MVVYVKFDNFFHNFVFSDFEELENFSEETVSDRKTNCIFKILSGEGDFVIEFWKFGSEELRELNLV